MKKKSVKRLSDMFASVTWAALWLEITTQAIRKAIKENRVYAEKVGNSWLIPMDEVKRFRLEKAASRKGRP